MMNNVLTLLFDHAAVVLTSAIAFLLTVLLHYRRRASDAERTARQADKLYRRVKKQIARDRQAEKDNRKAHEQAEDDKANRHYFDNH